MEVLERMGIVILGANLKEYRGVKQYC